MVRDVDLAEELAQEALVTALAEWPKSGVPDNPGAWLMAAAKRRAIDVFRRAKMTERKHAEIGRDLDQERDTAVAAIEAAMEDDDLDDELLGLIFTACHPVLSHARAHKAADTDRGRIAGLYDILREVMSLPVVDLNRRWRTATDFLLRAGRLAEARVEFERAAALDLLAK